MIVALSRPFGYILADQVFLPYVACVASKSTRETRSSISNGFIRKGSEPIKVFILFTSVCYYIIMVQKLQLLAECRRCVEFVGVPFCLWRAVF